MSSKYTPAVFQPTVRPSWAGILSYISEKERSDILEAIIKYPEETPIKSKFWEETVKPDLETQYQNFVKTCEARGRGPRTYWGEHKLYISSTYDEDKYNILKDKDKEKDKSKSKVQDKDKDEDKDKSEDKVNTLSVDNVDNFVKRVGDVQGIRITKDFCANNYPQLKPYVDEMIPEVISSVEQWLVKTKLNEIVDVRFIAKQFLNFARRQGKPYFKEGV